MPASIFLGKTSQAYWVVWRYYHSSKVGVDIKLPFSRLLIPPKAREPRTLPILTYAIYLFQLVVNLALVIYHAIDYNHGEDEERLISPDLESLITEMTVCEAGESYYETYIVIL